MKKMMKKNMKKIVSIALVLVLLLVPFSYLLNVKALEITVGEGDIITNTSTITVNKSGTITSLTGDVLEAYKVLDAYYNKDSNEISYKFTSLFEEFKSSEYAKNGVIDFSSSDFTVESYIGYGASDADTSEFESLVAQFAKYVKANSSAGTTLTVAGDGLSASATVVVGSYLVLPTVTNKVFTAMLGNVEIKANNNAWELQSANITAKGYTIGDSFDDSELESGKTKSIVNKGLGSASVVVGEEYNYYISTSLPKYPSNASNTTFIITETLDEGITFSGINYMSISDGGVGLTNDNGTFKNSEGATVASVSSTTSEDGKTVLTISFTPNNASSQSIEIIYKASLNSNAPYGEKINSTSKLTYAVDPYSTLDGANKTTGASTATAYTYGLKVKNANGAVFALYKVGEVETGSPIETATVGTDGFAVFKNGIAATTPDGTSYVLVQTKAAAGYRTVENKDITLTVGGDGYDSNTHIFTVEVETKEAGLLPSTGGLGTILYTLIGLFIITFSATAVVYYRKKKNTVTE